MAKAKTRRTAKRSAGVKGARRRTAGKKTTKTARRKNAARAAASRRTSAKRKTAGRTSTTRKTGARKSAARKTAARKTGTRKKAPAARSQKPGMIASAATAISGTVMGAVAAVKRRMPGTASMDALTLLETDHRRMEELLRQGEETTERASKGRADLLREIIRALTIHEMMEERLLYPALEKYPEAHKIVLEGFQEHHVADLIVGELQDVSPTDEQWGAKFKVLKENIEHHIQEEEGPMFRAARAVMPADELELLGARMAKMKADAEAGR